MLGITFRLTLIWVDFLGVCFAAMGGGGATKISYIELFILDVPFSSF